nr:MAG TPA: hypothetical protein [Caudoviricetes sp.]
MLALDQPEQSSNAFYISIKSDYFFVKKRLSFPSMYQ